MDVRSAPRPRTRRSRRLVRRGPRSPRCSGAARPPHSRGSRAASACSGAARTASGRWSVRSWQSRPSAAGRGTDNAGGSRCSRRRGARAPRSRSGCRRSAYRSTAETRIGFPTPWCFLSNALDIHAHSRESGYPGEGTSLSKYGVPLRGEGTGADFRKSCHHSLTAPTRRRRLPP